MKTCILCGEHPAILNSHIIPKFIVRLLKEGTPHHTLRHSNNLGYSAQDGWKGEYLCRGCENKFSEWENWFSRRIFKPYLRGTRTSFPMSAELALFAASVHFRYIHYVLDFNRVAEAPAALADLRELLRRICLDGVVPANGLHMYLEFEPLITDPALGFPPGVNAYLSDALDGRVFQWHPPGQRIEHVSFVKFPHMMLFCSLVPLLGSVSGAPIPTEIKAAGSLDAQTQDRTLLNLMREETNERIQSIQASYPLLPAKQHAKNVAKIRAAANIEQFRAQRAYAADQELQARWDARRLAGASRRDLPPNPAAPGPGAVA